MHPTIKVEVEVETFAELEEAFNAQPDIIMLDNFDIKALKEAVQERENAGLQHVELEASGGITEENLNAISTTGVDRISLGTLTKDVLAIDLSMRVELSQKHVAFEQRSADARKDTAFKYCWLPSRMVELGRCGDPAGAWDGRLDAWLSVYDR